MDINSYSDSDSDENSKLPQPSAEETGAAHTDDERDAQQARARPVAAPQNKHLNLQQRVPGLGTPVDGVEQVSTQKAAARLAGPSIGGAGGPVPEFVRRLLAEELKEWTLAQGEMPSNGVKGEMQLDYMARLETLAQLPCRTDDAVCNHWNRLQEPSTEPEQWRRPQQDARSQAQRWVSATGEQKAANSASEAAFGVEEDDTLCAGKLAQSSTDKLSTRLSNLDSIDACSEADRLNGGLLGEFTVPPLPPALSPLSRRADLQDYPPAKRQRN